MRYECRFVEGGSSSAEDRWDGLELMHLQDTVTGEAPRLETAVRAYWDSKALHIRFDCEDDYVAASMTSRDDPLYEEDVVEIFIDETGEGRRYLEFEVSPRNIVFDAIIHRDEAGGLQIDKEWNAEAMETQVFANENRRTYFISIPFEAFAERPQLGTVWRWNLYRIDDDPSGRRHYSAWSPTGKVNFHMPARFGELVFIADKRVYID
ncbi:carbohydrate-binding family 9-like protein [Paenibacillus sp.]|uniref:carbohydrate-binding family 9-like protein n=1 Tax=Paenibacillus sp. TaxID=58172 RepID=UPI002D5956DE|nr:carbohydrate-binding family 9-like protein [Paenibacillus sp.]HZG83636.1 carbohydrate-binding family 9-like protein [Paenibacillus sp.]